MFACCEKSGTDGGAGELRTADGKYKLTYFDIRGLAELCRMIFAVSKQEYEDFRYPWTMKVPGDFTTVVNEEFKKDQAAGKLTGSMGKLPFLEVGDPPVLICQSKAIERFLAREFGLMGSSPVQAAQIDGLHECCRDIKDAWQKVRTHPVASEKEAKVKEWFEKTLPELLRKLENAIPGKNARPGTISKWPHGVAVGGEMSLADLTIYHMLAAPKGTFPDAKAAENAMKDCPKIKSICAAVGRNPELQAYLAKRKDTMN